MTAQATTEAAARHCPTGHPLTADTIRVVQRWGRRVPVCGTCEDQRNGGPAARRRPGPIVRVVASESTSGRRTARVRKVGNRWCTALLVDGRAVGPVCRHADWSRAMLCATTWGETTSRVRVRDHPERAA